jgi:hypothetical protein
VSGAAVPGTGALAGWQHALVTWTRGRLVGVVSAALVALLLVGLTVSYVLSSRTMAQVSVTPDDLECVRAGTVERPAFLADARSVGDTQERRDDPSWPGYRVVDDGRDVECKLSVFVSNDGTLPVTVRSFSAGWWGSDGGSGFRADDLGGETMTPVDVPGSAAADARWPVDQVVEPGDFTWVQIGFVRPGTFCPDAGSLEASVPSIDLSSLGWRSSASTRLTIAARSVDEPDCSL